MICIYLLYILAITIHTTAFDYEICKNGLRWLNTSDIYFRHYTGTNVTQYVDYSLNDTNALANKLVSRQKVVVICHGFKADVESGFVPTVAQAFLDLGGYNVIAVKYSNLMNQLYPVVVNSVQPIAEYIAPCLKQLVKNNCKKLYPIGHSIGAQISGAVGRIIGCRIPRITGLDPAGPGFPPFCYLTSTDAEFVDVIHTDKGCYGTILRNGMVNFYPNGGFRVQRGCPKNPGLISDGESCSHSSSWIYFAISLYYKSAFVGVRCESLDEFNSGSCNNNFRAVMGYFTPTNVKGNYYLTTNATAPYGLGDGGAGNFFYNISCFPILCDVVKELFNTTLPLLD